MKQHALVGALILGLGLVACGGPSPISGPDPEPSTSYPYNPAPSAEEATDTRVPYLGDWAWVAKLPDGTERRGVVSIKTRGTPTSQARNGGVGPGYLCQDTECAVAYDPSNGVINTFIGNGQAQIGAVYVDPASTTSPPTNRLGILDSDSKVTVNAQNHAIIAGVGTWVEVTGQPGQTVKAAFVQMDTFPGDGIFGIPSAEAFTQAREAIGRLGTQGVHVESFVRLPTVTPALK